MNSQSSCRFVFCLVCAFLILPNLVACAAKPAAEPAAAGGEGEQASPAAAAPSAETAPASAPKYSVSYKTPTTQQIREVMDHLRDRLEKGTGTRIINNRTKEPITDLSVPTTQAALDSGPERKFSPYSYPMGVIYSGMLLANEVTGDPKYADFVAKRYQLFADNLPALSSWPKDRETMRRNPFRSILAPGSLDACGAMGASMTRAARMKVGPDLKDVIDRFATYVSEKQFRLEDGTLARKSPFPKSLWLDDAYMSVPLLAQYGKLTGERKYFDDAAKQIKSFNKYLFIPEKGLYTHAGNMDNPDDHPRYYWGRANGWAMVATVELLDLLPEDHPDRDALIQILRKHAQGVASEQSGVGLWHQMLDRTDSYLETSCSAMFTYAMAKGVNRGWLNASQYGPVAQAGWNGVVSKISPEGKLDGVCIGTNYADDYVYYYHRPATDDIHGYGPTLLAGSEMIGLVSNHKIRMRGSSTQPAIYTDAAVKTDQEQ